MKLTIEKVIYGGQGLARIPSDQGPQSGMRAFVPFTLPEEVVEAEITEEHRGYCVVEAREIERASEFRITPPCPWFGTCGGCQLQHATYAFQLELKHNMLAEALHRAGIRDLPPIQILAGAPFGYRNRIRLQMQLQPEFVIGYRHAKSHRLMAIDDCPIAAPLLDRCIRTIQKTGIQRKFPSDVRELELFTNHDQSELLMTLWVVGSSKFNENRYSELFGQMQAEIPQLRGAMLLAVEKSMPHATEPLLSWGQSTLRYRACGNEYIVSHRSFFQINATVLDEFVAAVTLGRSGVVAWDLYAGVGLFSRALAEQFRNVIAVESNSSACGDLQKNLHGTNAVAINSATYDFLRKTSRQVAERQTSAPDLILLDPPRAGAGVETCNLLARCNAPLILYVSCDPATLGRDLAVLIQSGYRLDCLQLVDMFPQTYHLETIATLQR
jgi:23S rRNA (uracil1939-C5)-methyltransferase